MVSVQGPLVLLHDILHVLVLLIPRNACRFSDFKSSSRFNIGICALYHIESVLRIPHARKGKEFPSNLSLYEPLNDLKNANMCCWHYRKFPSGGFGATGCVQHLGHWGVSWLLSMETWRKRYSSSGSKNASIPSLVNIMASDTISYVLLLSCLVCSRSLLRCYSRIALPGWIFKGGKNRNILNIRSSRKIHGILYGISTTITVTYMAILNLILVL